MKKQLLILSLAGLFSLTACGKSSRELKPVDDKTGLDRASAILAKEIEFAEQVTDDPKNFFNFFPNKFSLTIDGTVNGKARVYSGTGEIQIVEETVDNMLTADLKIEVNHDNLQFHIHEFDDPLYAEYNSFYDEAKGLFYSLTKSYSGEKTKISTPVANREEAEICFCNVVSEILLSSYSNYLLPINYLTSITEKNEDNEYYLLNTYKDIQTEYFDRFGNNDEYLKHQFGSNDENSFSLKNDVRINASYLPILESVLPSPEVAKQIVANGSMEGASSLYYNETLQVALGNYVFEYGKLGVPDLVVFENNYLSYALFTSTINAKSVAQIGMPEGALYQNTTEKTEINFVKDKANITNPNPDDYKEVE